ncbi:MAG: phosphate-starvation-inducible PsiE family protein [Acetobacteraceae bacterium]|nr:phosphate-starvation-inducible PsiE family protein [Acetobacteraceae bacterium]
MPGATQRGDTPARLSTDLFLHIEHGIYYGLGVLLALTAVLVLGGAVMLLWGGVREWTGTDAAFPVIDRLLFVLMLVEILHTVRVSIRSGQLSCEPFLIVGLIASIRRVLVITLETSQATKDGYLSQASEGMFRASMIELGVLAVLILVMVVSIYILHRSGDPGTLEKTDSR